jgi:hypothetical protein
MNARASAPPRILQERRIRSVHGLSVAHARLVAALHYGENLQ